MTIQPQCFVVIPYGKKDDPSRPGHPIDFERLYFEAIKPAIEDAGMEPVRAAEEVTLGIIHKAMFERLLLCDFAVADLSVPNPNVFYELGVRHASRRNTTLPIYAKHTQLPFDVALVRALSYELGADNALDAGHLSALRAVLAKRLTELRTLAHEGAADDSPFFGLLGKTQQSNLPADVRLRRLRYADRGLYDMLERYAAHDKTDIFRDVVDYSEKRRHELAAARARKPRAAAVAELDRIAGELAFDDVEVAVLIDLYLSYRAVEAYTEMLTLYDRLPRSLRRSVLVREQRAFAINRLAGKDPVLRHRRDEAVQLLEEITREIGPNPETQGLLGRIHKDRWMEASADPLSAAEARGHLARAIAAYLSGYEADLRDAYPGINVVTLLDIQGSPKGLELKKQLLPVVRYAVDVRMRAGTPDYWDVATLLELAVLEGDGAAARERADEALALVRESWEAGTTARNLGYISRARRERGVDTTGLDVIIGELEARAAR